MSKELSLSYPPQVIDFVHELRVDSGIFKTEGVEAGYCINLNLERSS